MIKKKNYKYYDSYIISNILFEKRNIFITVYKVSYNKKENNYKNFLKVLYSSSCGYNSKLFKNSNKMSDNSVKLLFFKFIFFLIKNNIFLTDLIMSGKNYYSDIILACLFKIKIINNNLKINCINNYYKIPYNGCRLKKYRYI
uniref:Ribosomal protein S11 n=1 Tax=Babesia rodhaini TaxID=5870 RepID=A0A455R067_BABRO|nr:ribosomal protein S11 [Babesia rodhaini]